MNGRYGGMFPSRRNSYGHVHKCWRRRLVGCQSHRSMLNADHFLTTLHRASNLPFVLLHHRPLEDIHLCPADNIVIIGTCLTSCDIIIRTEAVSDSFKHSSLICGCSMVYRMWFPISIRQDKCRGYTGNIGLFCIFIAHLRRG